MSPRSGSRGARWLVALLAAAGLVAGLAGVWRLHESRTVQLVGRIVARVATTDSLVALTFDDGPTPGFTDEVLAMLAEGDVRATFFVVGRDVERHLEEARRLVAAGHELGNHSWSHRPMLLKRPSWVAREVERTDSLIRAAGYQGPIHFRAPYCKRLLVLPWYLARTGRTHVTFDVEPESYAEAGRDSAAIVAHVRERAQPGSIILLHPFFESRRQTLAAVPAVIAELRALGYRFVTVSELLAAPASRGPGEGQS